MAAYRWVDGLTSPAGWLPVHWDQLRAQRLETSMRKLYLFIRYGMWVPVAVRPAAGYIYYTLFTQLTSISEYTSAVHKCITLPLPADESPSVTQPVSVLAWVRSRRASIHARSISLALQKRNALTTESFSFTCYKYQQLQHVSWETKVKLH